MGCREESGEEIRCGCNSEKTCPRENEKNNDLDNNPDNYSYDSNNLEKESVNVINKENPHEEKLWRYRGQNVDLSRFLRFHPGGTPPLKHLKGKELEQSMKTSSHSSEAYYLLRDFYSGNADEDIVDWNKAMLGQVGSLGPLYESWVWSPVDRPLRLFEYEWLEKLTRTNWRQVVGVWVPVIITSLILSFFYSPSNLAFYSRLLGLLLSTVCGAAVWPLLEYSIHRWLFHLQPPKSSSLLITIHFGLHGLHHKVPFDEGRLLFPPGPCSFMALALYQIYTRVFPWWMGMAFFSGTMLGYLIYDLIHYYLHHGNPKDGTYLYHMKRYHNQHHFAQQEKGFGISSDFWDHAFDTLIKLRKLSKPLTWES